MLNEYTDKTILDEVECDTCSANYCINKLNSLIELSQINTNTPNTPNTPPSSNSDISVDIIKELQSIVGMLKGWMASGYILQNEHDSWFDFITNELISPQKNICHRTEIVIPNVHTASFRPETIDIIDNIADSVREQVSKQLQIARCSPCLCLHINRNVNQLFGSTAKVNTHVQFPLVLNIRRYLSTHLHSPYTCDVVPPVHTYLPYVYYLKAVIVHAGNQSGGNFTSVVYIIFILLLIMFI